MARAAAKAQALGHPQPPPPRPGDQQQKVLTYNADRLKLIANGIRALLRGTGGAAPSAALAELVFALARGIDFAVSAGDVPSIAGEVPDILRKVYELRKEPSVQSSVMVLVISCKNASSNKWFQPTDSEDILRMASELCGNFCTSLDPAADDTTVLGIISKIIPRYYPHLKFERLVTSMEAKVGYDILMTDFFIERNLPRDEKISLIVVQKENLDASSCIVSPPHVSFLVNGKGVDNRTNVSMGKGPQLPTDITRMLKYGANIIQAVGNFNANYLIAIAYLKHVTSFGPPTLDDYAQPVTVDPADSDVLEGPSRVSLNCPISLRRIKTPIKGHLCKHYQCFDYDNYIKTSLRNPTWRCPYCDTPANFTEIRIDQKMTKILQETGDDIMDVLLFADGSWEAAQAHNEKSDRHTVDTTRKAGDTVEADSSSSHVIDLINGNDNDLPMNRASASEDTKPLLNTQEFSVSGCLLDLPIIYLKKEKKKKKDLPIIGPAWADDTASSMAATSAQNLLVPSPSGLGSSTLASLEPILPQNVLRPVTTDAVSPLGTFNSTSEIQHDSQAIHPETVQLQPQMGPPHGSEVRSPVPSNPRLGPIRVQELPVSPQNPGLQQNILNCPPPVPRPASSTYEAHLVMNPSSVMAPINSVGGPMPRASAAASLLQRQSTTLDMHNASNHLPNRVAGLPAPHLMGTRLSTAVPRQTGGGSAYRSTPLLNELLLHNRVNHTAQVARGQTNTVAQVGPTQSDIQSHLFHAQESQASRAQTVPRAASPLVVRQASSHLQSPSESTVSPSTPQSGVSDGLPELPLDENWRPTGRMRGSLTGNAYSQAIERYLGQAAQPQTRARPPNASDARKPH